MARKCSYRLALESPSANAAMANVINALQNNKEVVANQDIAVNAIERIL